MRISLISALVLVIGLAGIGDTKAAAFYAFEPHSGPIQGPASQAHLNRSLGPEDRLSSANGHFFRAGSDKTPGTPDDVRVRLYGVNLSYSANFPAPDNARLIARRLRSLGFNAVRLHHLDSAPDANADSATSLLNHGPYPSFNGKAVARLRNFIQVLKEEGIYTNLNVYVGYRFRPVADRFAVQGQTDTPLEPGSPIGIFYPPLVRLQTQYAQDLIHQLGLRGEAALAMVEIRNESSLAANWQSWDARRWSESVQGVYAEELTSQWNDWLQRKYGTIEKACAMWGTCSSNERQSMPTPAEADQSRAGRIGLVGAAMEKARSLIDRVPFLSKDKIEAGPTGALLRLTDFASFLVDTDKRYLDDMKRVVRSAVNFDVPVTGTQMAFGGALNVLSHAGMDYVDDHFYVDHYQFPNAAWDYYDWRIKDSSLTGGEMAELTNVSRYRDMRRPFVVSEYNQAYPNRRGAEIMPAVAAYAAAQDWDGLFFFDYIDGDTWSNLPSGFRLSGDWSKLAFAGLAARIFRTPDFAPASTEASLPLSHATILNIGAQRRRERRGLIDADPAQWPADAAFSQRRGILVGTGASSPAEAPPAVRRDGPLQYSKDLGNLTFDGASTAGFLGQIRPGQRIDFKAFSLESPDPQKDFMAIMVSTLDGQPFATSRQWLVALPGQILGSQPGSMPARPKKLAPYGGGTTEWWTLEPDATAKGKPSGARDAQGPLWMEKMPARLIFHTPPSDIQVFQLGSDGSRGAPLARTSIIKRGTALEVSLQMELNPKSPWYEIVLAPGLSAK